MLNALKEKIVGSFGSISALLSTLGSSWNVCHSICTALLAFLAGFGIIVAGMPLFFLFEYAVYFWAVAAALLAVSLALFFRMPKCMPKKLLVFNFGAVVAGIPADLLNLQPFSWIVGGFIMALAIVFFLIKKLRRQK